MHTLLLQASDALPLILEETLRARGYEVHRAADAEAAWAVYERTQPDLVVLARVDPESLALCRRIRATARGETALVLAVAGKEALDAVEEAVEAGVDDCLQEREERAYYDNFLALAERRRRKRERHLQIEIELAARVRQQATVAELGQRLLAGAPVQDVMNYAVRATARALDVPFCEVLVRVPGQDGLLLAAGVGWKSGLVGKAVVETDEDSQAGHTLRGTRPVVVEDLRTETRFSGPSLLREHGVVSGVSVLLKVEGEPYGVLGAHTDRLRTFRQDDVNFLRSVATLLAGAVERKRGEDTLLRERNFVSAVLDTAGALVLVLDAQGRIVRFNRTCEQTTGYTFDEVRGSSFERFLDLDEAEEVRGVFGHLVRGTYPSIHRNYWLTRQGARRLIDWSNTVLFDEAGDVAYVIGIGIDVTERKRTEEALKESEARFRAILDTTVDGIITIDERGIIESFNVAAERIFGYRAAEVVGKNVKILMPSPYREEHDGFIQNYRETGHRKIIGIGREVVGQRKDGSVFPLELAVSEVCLDDRRIFTGMVRDVSERRHLEQEILRISEQERRRIGQDLHDGLGQMLTGIGLIAQNLARMMQARAQPGADDMIEITELIKEADQHARGLARGLVPVDLEATGLTAALERLAVNAERLFGVRCAFEQVGSVLIHDNSVATHLYRIAQEAVSNAVKHGRARHVKISLASGRGQVRLRLQDDGVGFPDHLDDERQGMGVRIMHYRARVIGATLEIGGGIDGGTTITCTLRHIGESIHQAAGANV